MKRETNSDEQHAILAREVHSVWRFTVGFSNIYGELLGFVTSV